MKIFLLIIAFAQSVLLIAQNLVPNPSFEEYYNCPANLGRFKDVKDWTNPTKLGSPDYYNRCALDEKAGVPYNFFGDREAHSGNGYMGIGTYWVAPPNSREYIQTRLLEPLKIDSTYYVSFYASLASDVQKATANIGCCFLSSEISNYTPLLLSYTPQLETNSIPLASTNWTYIRWSYTATGNENYMIIGNFRSDQQTTIINTGVGNEDMAYYFIDDVCVSLNPADCGIDTTTTSITNIAKPQFDLLLYPNPASTHIEISYTALPGTHYSYEVTDLLGRVLLKSEQMSDTGYEVVEVKALASGMYFFKCMVNGNVAQTNTFIVKH